jgi:hypothetical protein
MALAELAPVPDEVMCQSPGQGYQPARQPGPTRSPLPAKADEPTSREVIRFMTDAVEKVFLHL